MSHILFTTIGTAGDVVPFVRIGSQLKERGHTVTVVSSCASERIVTSAGLDFAPLDTLAEAGDRLADGTLSNSPQGFLTMHRKFFLPNIAAEYDLIRRLCDGRDAVLVTRSTPAFAALCAAETLHLPLVSVFFAPNFLHSFPLFEELVDSMLGHDLNQVRARLGLSQINDWKSWLRIPAKWLGLWPDWFAEAGDGVQLGGFVLPKPRAGAAPALPPPIEEFLAGPDRPVLLTGGTGAFAARKTMAACVDACRQLGWRGIVVAPRREEVAHCLSQSFRWCQEAPFEYLAPRLRLAIHHGGIGTTAQMLAAGIPHLVIGMGADRPDNASHLKRLGVAEYVPPARQNPDVIRDSLRRLMSPDIHRNCEDIAGRMAASDGAQAASDAIEAALSESNRDVSGRRLRPAGGSSGAAPGLNSRRAMLDKAVQNLSPEKRAAFERRLQAAYAAREKK